MRQFFILVVVFGILALDVFGATIYGTIYDFNLNTVSGAKVEINTEPKQILVSKDGSYSFEVPVGNYELKASYFENNALISSATEAVNVKSEGRFVVDLILFPSFEEEEQLMKEDVEVGNVLAEKNKLPIIISIIALIIIVLLVIYFKKYKKKLESIETKVNEQNESSKKEIAVVSKDLDGIIKILEEEGGRSTQKEIRKRIPLSEAKISLMISELESKGVVKRIKKGRGNIIVLNK